MGKLNFTHQRQVLLKVNEMFKDLTHMQANPRVQEKANRSTNVHIEDWLEVYAADQVITGGCAEKQTYHSYK